MTDRPDEAKLSEELAAHAEAEELEAFDRVAERVVGEDPHPSAAFRSELHQRLREQAHELPPGRPARLWLLVATYASSGLALLALAALGAAGWGPIGI